MFKLRISHSMVNKKLLVLSTFFFLNISDVKAQSVSVICDNIKGTSLLKTSSGFDAKKDGFRGTTIRINIEPGKKIWNVNWSGGTKLRDSAMHLPGGGQQWTSGVSFISPEVVRIYTIFFGGALAISEHQTQLMTNRPQVRSFFGSCREQ